jgi:hypothetical protein
LGEKFHFWVGSLCNIFNGDKSIFPEKVTALSDIIKINSDLGNHIPDKSWMIYLFELFVYDMQRKGAIELDLFCEFDNDIFFEAVFGGHNLYSFRKILPAIGNSYQREIILDRHNRIINYKLTDLNTREFEIFEFGANKMSDKLDPQTNNRLIKNISKMKFEGSEHFTGIEWWNLVNNTPFPIRYQIEVSMLRYAQSDSLDTKNIRYIPFSSLIPYTDGAGKRYPISFENPRLMDNCICYNVNNGNTSTGLTYRI